MDGRGWDLANKVLEAELRLRDGEEGTAGRWRGMGRPRPAESLETPSGRCVWPSLWECSVGRRGPVCWKCRVGRAVWLSEGAVSAAAVPAPLR